MEKQEKYKVIIKKMILIAFGILLGMALVKFDLDCFWEYIGKIIN